MTVVPVSTGERQISAPIGAVSVFAGATEAPLRVSTHVSAGVAVVALRGHLQRRSLMRCRSGVGAALDCGGPTIVLDLRQCTIDHESLPVLALMRRYCARHGARLLLVTQSLQTVAVLRDAQALPFYRILPTLPVAVAVAATLGMARSARPVPVFVG